MSKGSHFEKLWFGNEIMIADENLNMKISVFTFKFLEETGWYKPMYDRREIMTYLRGEGCTIMNSSCRDHSRTCDTNIQGQICSYDYTGLGYCKSGDEFTDGCSLYHTNNMDCRNPQHAGRVQVESTHDFGNRCFEGIMDPDLIFGKENQP